MGKIAVIGDRDSILAFNALGVTVFATSDPKEAAREIAALAKSDTTIIYITEKLAIQMEKTLEVYKNKMTPAIIMIPDNRGSDGAGIRELRSRVERAIGTDIFK